MREADLGNGQDSVHIPLVPLLGLDHLGWGIVVRNIQPQTYARMDQTTHIHKTQQVSTCLLQEKAYHVTQLLELLLAC